VLFLVQRAGRNRRITQERSIVSTNACRTLAVAVAGLWLSSCTQPPTKPATTVNLALPQAVLGAQPLANGDGALMERGVALHDKGQYRAAVAVYDSVLARNEACVVTLYEKSLSQLAAGMMDSCVATCMRGLQYRFEQRVVFFVNLGAAWEGKGEPDKAVAVYEAGIREYSDAGALWLDLGIAVGRRREYGRAETCFQKSIALDPKYASGHYALAETYRATGRTAAALLAYSRFLILEPQTSRSRQALVQMKNLWDKGTQDRRIVGGVVTVTVPQGEKGSRDELAGLAFAALSVHATNLTDSAQTNPEPQRTYLDYEALYGMAGEMAPKATSFCLKYYGPYFGEAAAKGLLRPMWYYAQLSGVLPGVKEWLAANTDSLSAFLRWSAGYQWPVALQ
jgi:tetratricopeptide (TPR) repeat protein